MIRLEDIRKTYGEGNAADEVLRGITLDSAAREFVALVGASGSGKSTLLNILGCLDRPTAGRYWLGDDEVATLEDDRLSEIRNRHIGFIFQSFQLIPQLDVVENVEVPLFYARVGRADRRRRAIERLERVGLGHRLHHLPSQLSGGEKQRVAIARSLVGDPTLLLADEPTGNLDSVTGAEIIDLIRGLHEDGRTILMITHDRHVAAEAPRRVRILDGVLQEDEVAA